MADTLYELTACEVEANEGNGYWQDEYHNIDADATEEDEEIAIEEDTELPAPPTAQPVKTEFDVYRLSNTLNPTTSALMEAIRPLHVRLMLEQVRYELWMRDDEYPFPSMSLNRAVSGYSGAEHPVPEGDWATASGLHLYEDSLELFRYCIAGQQHPTSISRPLFLFYPKKSALS